MRQIKFCLAKLQELGMQKRRDEAETSRSKIVSISLIIKIETHTLTEHTLFDTVIRGH